MYSYDTLTICYYIKFVALIINNGVNLKQVICLKICTVEFRVK